MSAQQELTENPLAVVHEVLQDWLEQNEATDFDENDVAHLFGMLGTAGYSIVPNAPAPLADAALAELVDRVAGYEDEMEEAIALGNHHPDLEASHKLLQHYVLDSYGLLARLRAAEAAGWASLPSDFQAVLHLSKSAQTLTKLVGVLDRLPKSMVRKMSADAEEAMYNARNEAINLAGSIKPVIDQLNASATKAMEGGQPNV